MKKIWLIRHAESESNAGMRSSDPAMIPLSLSGLEQAKKLVEKFIDPPNLVITSPYIRTQETAAPLLEKYPDIPREEWRVHEFTFLSPSRCRNTTQVERLPMVKEYWGKSDPAYCDGQEAESFIDLIDRAKSAINKLKKVDEKFIVLFSHEQFITAVLWVGFDKEPSVSRNTMMGYRAFLGDNRIPNTGIREIFID